MATHIEVHPDFIDDHEIKCYTMAIDESVAVELIEFGATITKILVPNRYKNPTDVLLGFNDLSQYAKHGRQAMGGTLGRVANRIKNGSFVIPKVVQVQRRNSLEGKIYKATQNDGKNTLNGGEKGLHLRFWESKIENENTVKMWYESADGEEGFPGKVLVEVFFSLIKNGYNTAALVIEYKATTDDAITPLSITTHPFFNLSGHDSGSESIYNSKFQINCDEYLVMDDTFCPTGEIRNVFNTCYDMRDFEEFRERIPDLKEFGYESVFAVEDAEKDIHLRNVAYVLDDKSGIFLELSTDHPTLYFSTLNISDDIPGKNDTLYTSDSGFCLAPQMFPDACNHKNFPKNLISESNPYHRTNCYMFGTIYY